MQDIAGQPNRKWLSMQALGVCSDSRGIPRPPAGSDVWVKDSQQFPASPLKFSTLPSIMTPRRSVWGAAYCAGRSARDGPMCSEKRTYRGLWMTQGMSRTACRNAGAKRNRQTL